MKAGKVRIIGGKWRSRQLLFPGANGLRPTPDAVRETLFNWLSSVITDCRCLDLYAGSGALGFEAVSRGAASAVLVENNPKVGKALSKNQKLIDTDHQLRVTECAALQYLSTTREQFDIIFLDPPFRKGYLPKTLDSVFEQQLLNQQGLIP